jgi:translocation and assembly module TamB
MSHLALAVEGRPDRLNSLAVKAFEVRFGDGLHDTGRWQGEGRWQGGVLQLQTRLVDVALAGLDKRLPAVRLRGPVNLSLEPQHNAATPQALLAKLEAQLQGAPAAPGAPAFTLGARADATLPSLTTTDGWQFAVRELKANAGEAQATAIAQAARHGEHWQASGHGELHRFDPAQWWRGEAGSAWRTGHHRLNGRWTFEGDGPAAGGNTPLAGHASLQLDPSTLADVPLQGHASLKTAGAQAIAIDAAVDSGSNHLQARGQWHWLGHRGKDAWDLQARLPEVATLGPLARLSPALAPWAPSAGNGTLEAHFEGRWPRMRSTGHVELNGVKAGDFSAVSLRSQWQADLATAESEVPLDASLTIEQARVGVQAVSHVGARLTGSARAHQLSLRIDTAARPPAWAETLTNRGQPIATALLLRANGRWTRGGDADRWSLQIEDLRAGTPEGEAVGGQLLEARDVHAELGFAPEAGLRQITAEPGSVRLLGAALRWSELRWQAGADAEAPPHLDVQAQLEPLRVAPLLARLQPDFGWGGDLAVRGHVVIRTGTAVHIDTVVERDSGDLSVTDEGGTQTLGLTDLRLGLAADQGRWYFTQALAGQTVGVLAGAQSLQLPAKAWWPTAQTPMQGVLELRVDNLGVWGPWTPPGWRLAGTLHTVATLGGRFGAPEYTGRLEAHGLGARNLLEGVNVTDGEVLLALNGPTAEVQQFTLKGGDGSATLSGGASFGEAPRAQLQLKATRFQVLGRVDRRMVASGQAQLQLQKDAVALEGRLRIDEGLFDFSRSNAPTLDDDVSVVRPSKANETSVPAAAARPRRLDLQMAVDLGDHLRLRGHGIDTLLRGELRMTTPNGKFAVHGTVRADQGTYAAYGQKLDIERGLVEFNGALADPRLDILALRPNVDVRVGVAVTGTAQKPRVKLYSEPEMSDNDKLSWLVLGRAPENLGHNDAALLQHAAMALLAGEGDTPTDRVMQALGLDEFTVRQQGEGDVRTTIVSLGKQISRRWYVGYERGLQSTTGTWALIYRIAQRFTLRAQSGEDNAIDVIWSWRWN